MSVTVPSIPSKIQYVATEGQTEFAIPFVFFDDGDIKVYEGTSTDPIDSGDYALTGAGEPPDGNLSYSVGKSEGTVVTINRESAVDRTSNFSDSSDWTADNVNTQFNRIITFIQEVKNLYDQAVKLPVTTTLAQLLFPTPEAGKVPKWNSGGTGLVNSTYDPDTLASSAAASAELAEEKADAAAVSETNAAASAAKLQGTSASSVGIAVGSKAFTTQSGKFFDVGKWLLIMSDADETNYMHGQVTAYSGTSLTVNVTNIGGAGTFDDWVISISGTRGAAGLDGDDGADGEGLIVGGGTDDILAKNSGTDYDTKWIAKASQAEAEAGTATDRWMTPEQTKQAIDANASGVTAASSLGNAITSNGTVTFSHGLGALPKGVLCTIKCTTADNGYSIGDEVIVGDNIEQQGAGGGSYGCAILISTTNANVEFGSAPFMVKNLSTNAIANITNTSWEFNIYVWS